eukprot:TRINITY_DN6165_c1_g1_i1.p1 TRINITY_DN6165_c1_g1~~TRINITY_DN6165_c1_g1_i1.p1  ORF type:complete len:348 (-),score=81.78 TRINITY_DN6165_c1_g1_i1:56-1099(-)
MTEDIETAIKIADFEAFERSFDPEYSSHRPNGMNWVQFAMSYFKNDIRFIEKLIQFVDSNEKNAHGYAPLFLTLLAQDYSRSQKEDLVKVLLSKDSTDPNLGGEGGHSPMYLAILKDMVDVVRLLLQHPKFDIDQVYESPSGEKTHLFDVAYNRNRNEIVDLFLQSDKMDAKMKEDAIKQRETRRENMVGLKERIESEQKKNSESEVTIATGDSFQVTSGLIVWGQFKTCWKGYTEDAISTLSQPPLEHHGTILCAQQTFRSAARNGTWKVKRLPFGYIVYHEEEDPDLVRDKCLCVGLGEDGSEWGTIRVNRYDWSWRFQLSEEDQTRFEAFLNENSIPIEKLETK